MIVITGSALLGLRLLRRVHPEGGAVSTVHTRHISRHLPHPAAPSPPFAQVDRGANTQIWLAAGADGGGSYRESGGQFLQNLKPLQGNPLAEDPALGARLWAESERLTGTPFVI